MKNEIQNLLRRQQWEKLATLKLVKVFVLARQSNMCGKSSVGPMNELFRSNQLVMIICVIAPVKSFK
jgi:hypothetical protein